MRPHLAPALVALLLTACMGSVRETTTAHTPQELLLVNTAAERAARGLDVGPLIGKRVFIDARFLETYREEYLVSSLRDHLARQGAIVLDAPGGEAPAEVVLEVRSGTHALYEADWRFGIPSVPVSPSVGGQPDVVILGPDFTFGYGTTQGWAKLEMWAYDPRNGEYLGSTGPLWGSSYEAIFDDIWPKAWPGQESPVNRERGQ